MLNKILGGPALFNATWLRISFWESMLIADYHLLCLKKKSSWRVDGCLPCIQLAWIWPLSSHTVPDSHQNWPLITELVIILEHHQVYPQNKNNPTYWHPRRGWGREILQGCYVDVPNMSIQGICLGIEYEATSYHVFPRTLLSIWESNSPLVGSSIQEQELFAQQPAWGPDVCCHLFPNGVGWSIKT